MYDLLVEEPLQESDAEYQTVLQNILDEPVAEERKRRLFSALLLKAYQPISGPWDSKKSRNTRPAMGLEILDPFHSMYYEQSQSAQTKWLDILVGRADDMKSWLQNVQGQFTRAEKTGRHSQLSTHLWDCFLHQRGSGWLVCFCRPRKGVCSKQECAQLEVCNFSKMMVHRESLT